MNKTMRYAPMWEVDNVYFHHSDKDRAGQSAVLKWVIMDSDYFIGTWQFGEHFVINIFDSEDEARRFVEDV